MEDYHNSLKKEHQIPNKQTNKTTTKFCRKTLGELINIQIFCDILFLADVFNRLVEDCFEFYKSSPSIFVSMSGYTYQCALKKSNTEIDISQARDFFYQLKMLSEEASQTFIGLLMLIERERRRENRTRHGRKFFTW